MKFQSKSLIGSETSILFSPPSIVRDTLHDELGANFLGDDVAHLPTTKVWFHRSKM